MKLDGHAPNIAVFSRALIGVPRLIVDEDDNDSDKTFFVRDNTQWVFQSIWIEFVSDGTGGDRQLEIQILDQTDDIIASMKVGVVQPASKTRKYLLAPGVSDLTAFRDTDFLTTPLPSNWVILGGYSIRIFDNNAVAVAGDDMNVQMLVLEMDTVIPDAITRREFGDSPGAEQLVLSFTAPKIGIFPVFQPDAAQLVIDGKQPALSGAHDVPLAEQLVISTTAPSRSLGIGRVPGLENLVITGTAPIVDALGKLRVPAAAQLTITPIAPAVSIGIG